MSDVGGDKNELLTSEQVMDRLLADANLRRVALRCVLPAVWSGTGWRYRKSDLDAWISREMALTKPANQQNS